MFIGVAVATVVPDTLSDQVGATAGQFRVDESGSATYSIPIYTPPGTTGVAPQLALSYTSQGGDGPMGKGWSVSGMSAITRCRASREAGDFIGAATADGDPAPINFSTSDRFCLDGQRLIPAAGTNTCKTLSGTTVAQYTGEIDSQQRVCAYTLTGGPGPRFFSVERKDGSTSWFGDRRYTAPIDPGDYPSHGELEGNVGAGIGTVLSWAITRFQDSTGNYIDFFYKEGQAGSGYPGEQHIWRVAWSGKNVLSGQAGAHRDPYSWIDFNYTTLPTTEFSRSVIVGSQFWQTQRLDNVTVTADVSNVVRYYALNYQYAVASPHTRTLATLTECSDATQATCMAPTTFNLSAGKTSYATAEYNATTSFNGLVSYKMGDVDGDGRQDIIWVKNVNDSGCSKSRVYVAYGELDGSGNAVFTQPAQTGYCIPLDMDKIEDAWNVLDYNGDGRDDIMVPTTTSWAIYPSIGRPVGGGNAFDTSNNLVAGLTPSIPALNNGAYVPDLADLNGDGQLDAIYAHNDGTMYARLAERQADGSWGWGAERTLLADLGGTTGICNYRVTCSIQTLATNFGHTQLKDFNGDSRSDLLFGVTQFKPKLGGNCIPQGPIGGSSGFTSNGGFSQARAIVTPQVGQCYTATAYLVAMVVSSITPTSVSMSMYSNWRTAQDATVYISNLKFADINGDGLTDVLTTPNGSDWTPAINQGNGLFVTGTPITAIPNNKYMQFTDVNGDGRADIVYPQYNSGTCAFVGRMALPDGSYASQTSLEGGNAQACGNGDLTSKAFIQVFADLDGDGTTDYARLRADGDGVFISRSLAGNRFQPRDVVQTITNGLGAITQMLYTPLTNAAVYRPDTNARNTHNDGRGSPTVDLLAPMYVVGYVESSAPVFGNPSAMSYLYYNYAGAKMQGGGRGFLGFREITTIDANPVGHFVATTNDYLQAFPFVGSPQSTTKTVVNGTYAPATCLTNITNACFLAPGYPFTPFTGTAVAQNTHIWEASPTFNPAVQQTLQVRTLGTEEKLRDLASAATTSDVWTSFLYDSDGDVTQSTVDTYADDHTTLLASVVTANNYTNDHTNWRLGRLTDSTVTHTRGVSSIVRTTAFTYDTTSAANTGLLLSERIQPGGASDQDRRTVYTLDDYGNRIATTTCSADVATCGPTGTVFHPVGGSGPSLTVQRYARAAYDSGGHYPVSTTEPFWNGTGLTEVMTQQVLARSPLGDVLQAVNAQGVHTLAVPGTLGRTYYTWAQTVAGATTGDPAGGAESWSTYRWCGTGTNKVSCPLGAVFRQRIVAEGAPTKWTYFDVLGRPLLAVGQTFNVGVTQQEFAGACSYSDNSGRAERSSIPFFLSDPNSGGEPSFATQTNPCGSRAWAVTSYDVLGRPLQVSFADGSMVSSSYTGLTTTATDQLGHHTVVLKNALGEKLTVNDSAGLTTYYNYDPAGDLTSVTRDGGRGAIATSFTYDSLGRKRTQTDADTGTYSYDYNANGELLRQTDAKGQRVESDIDARGRVWRKHAYTTAGTLETESLFNFDYDASAPGVQTLGAMVSESIVNNITASDTISRGYSFDALGRPAGKAHVIDGNTYSEVVLYDPIGRVQESRDATGHWLRSEYTTNGFVRRQCEGDGTDTNVCSGVPAETYVETIATDNWGHATSEHRGVVVTSRSYDVFNGRLLATCSGTAGVMCGLPTCSTNCPLQDETYTWDAKGNLLTRSRGTTYTERFAYDANDRVTLGWYSVLNGISYPITPPANPATDVNVTEWMSYDPLGNICQRTDTDGMTRAYTYAKLGGCGLSGLPGGVNAGSTANSGYQLLAAGSENFATDANGSMTVSTNSGGTVLRGWNYDTQNRAVEVYKGATPASASIRTRWDYDADGARFRRTDDGTNGPNDTTLYLDNVERTTTGVNITWRRTIAGVAVMALVGANPSLPTTNFLLQDHIGSIVAVANVNGALVERGDYSAFGGMRTAIDGVNVGLAALSTTTRGFTGHEQLGSLDLIHMNGRIYDPSLGRFLQADPMVQDPGNPQNWNPYSYVFNNPLVNTDPTGMFSIGSFLRTIASIAISIWFPGIAQFLWEWNLGVATVVGGFAAGVVGSGSLKGGIINAFSAGLTYGIGISGWSATDKLIGNAAVGGIVSVLDGGKFGNGFVSAGLTALAMPVVGGKTVTRSVEGALIGGTISDLTGGKFANGAISGAIQGAFQGPASNESNTDKAEDEGVNADMDPRRARELEGKLKSELPAARDAAITGLNNYATHWLACFDFDPTTLPDVKIQFSSKEFYAGENMSTKNPTMGGVPWRTPSDGITLFAGGMVAAGKISFEDLVSDIWHEFKHTTPYNNNLSVQYHTSGITLPYNQQPQEIDAFGFQHQLSDFNYGHH